MSTLFYIMLGSKLCILCDMYSCFAVTLQLFTEFMLILKRTNCVEHVNKLKALHTMLEEIMPTKPQVCLTLILLCSIRVQY